MLVITSVPGNDDHNIIIHRKGKVIAKVCCQIIGNQVKHLIEADKDIDIDREKLFIKKGYTK